MNPNEVAAIFVEPIQGEGGYVVSPAGFLKDLRALCDKHGILLVCDEIQSGTGRTGKWFAYEHFDIIPDITLMSKGIASGMPIGAVIAREGVMEWPPGAQGSTFTGNPVCCAAALATLDLVEKEYMANATAMGKVLIAGLSEVARKHKPIGTPRGLGLMCGVDVLNSAGAGDPALRDKIVNACLRARLDPAWLRSAYAAFLPAAFDHAGGIGIWPARIRRGRRRVRLSARTICLTRGTQHGKRRSQSFRYFR